MIILKIVVDKQCEAYMKDLLYGKPEDCMDSFPFKKLCNYEFHNVDTKAFIPKRTANKIANDYAVTQLPFVLITEGDNEYAAVYSEEGPITIERINNKL